MAELQFAGPLEEFADVLEKQVLPDILAEAYASELNTTLPHLFIANAKGEVYQIHLLAEDPSPGTNPEVRLAIWELTKRFRGVQLMYFSEIWILESDLAAPYEDALLTGALNLEEVPLDDRRGGYALYGEDVKGGYLLRTYRQRVDLYLGARYELEELPSREDLSFWPLFEQNDPGSYLGKN